jgi:hypothetical protein
MPWRQMDAMTERFQFIRDARRRLVTFTELSALYGISRWTPAGACSSMPSGSLA